MNEEDIDAELYRELGEKRVFKGAPYVGSGSLLALKLLLQSMGDIILIINGRIATFATNVPMVYFENASAAATGLRRATDKKIVCFSDDINTGKYLRSVLIAAENNENFIYVCHNSQTQGMELFSKFIRNGFVASASLAFPNDYVNKLRKCPEGGFSFIEVLCPEPDLWGFDVSNTVQVARLAVETRIWPVFEINNGKVTITRRPEHEPIDRFLSAQKRFNNITEEEKHRIQINSESFWKQLREESMK